MAIEPNGTPTPAPSPAELQAEIAAARDELVASITALRGQVQPDALARRAAQNVKGVFTDDLGSPRLDRIGMVAGALVGFIVLRALIKR